MHITSGFTQAGVYARRNLCELASVLFVRTFVSPRLYKATTTLHASGLQYRTKPTI